MTRTSDDLRRKILRSAHKAVGEVVPSLKLGKPEVRKSDVTFFIQQNVLWFQISIDDACIV